MQGGRGFCLSTRPKFDYSEDLSCGRDSLGVPFCREGLESCLAEVLEPGTEFRCKIAAECSQLGSLLERVSLWNLGHSCCRQSWENGQTSLRVKNLTLLGSESSQPLEQGRVGVVEDDAKLVWGGVGEVVTGELFEGGG